MAGDDNKKAADPSSSNAGNPPQVNPSPPVAQISKCAAVSIKPPQFSSNNARGWFCNIEAQFLIAGIVKGVTKFTHVVAHLPPSVAEDLGHIVFKDKIEEEDYAKLKEEIIRFYSESKTKRLNLILDTEQMGDRTPSQFYRFLKSKTSDLDIPDGVLYNRWLSKLPSSIQMTIAGIKEKLTEIELLEHADNIYELSTNSSKTVAYISDNRGKPQGFHKPRNSFPKRGFSHSPARDRSPSRDRTGRGRSPSRDRNGSTCWYHRRFKEQARKCAGGGCNFKNSGKGRQ